MIGTYDEDMIKEISDSVNLLEYIEQSIDLKPKGRDYFGNCPLHIDKTPSFSVTPEKNNFFCFGCGRGGGIIQFLIEYESMSYDDAVLKASHLANIDISKMCQSETVKINKTIRKCKQKPNIITHEILDKKELEKYTKEKIPEWLEEDIRQEEIDLFDIRIDHRSNRIVYPVYDLQGNLINIKGRTRYENYKAMGISKYINYFKVGEMDYFQGLNITLPFIKETNEIKIFESIKSGMKLMKYSIKDSASAEKHTLTIEQIKLLIRIGADVVLCYDSDVSYKDREVRKNIETLKRFLNVYIVEDSKKLLGGKESKNSPIDCGIEIWNELYANRKKII